jgi:hypothetical protein
VVVVRGGGVVVGQSAHTLRLPVCTGDWFLKVRELKISFLSAVKLHPPSDDFCVICCLFAFGFAPNNAEISLLAQFASACFCGARL